MSWLLLGLLVAVAAVAFELQRRVYERLVRTLENDRDAARNEAKVFRGLLFPVLNKTAVSEGAVDQDFGHLGKGSDSSSSASSKPVARLPEPTSIEDIWRMRIPYRDKFKLLRKLTNSKQQKTDALASAIQKQKPVQEKINVSS